MPSSNKFLSLHVPCMINYDFASRFEHADQKCETCGLVFVGRLKYDKHMREAHKSLTICELVSFIDRQHEV